MDLNITNYRTDELFNLFNLNLIKVFHNLRDGPVLTRNPSLPGLAYSTWTRTDKCTQISLFSFIETTGTVNTLILNIHTVNNYLYG